MLVRTDSPGRPPRLPHSTQTMRSRFGKKKKKVLSVLTYALWDVKHQLSYLLTYALSAVTREMRPGVILVVCVVVTNLLLPTVGDLSPNASG